MFQHVNNVSQQMYFDLGKADFYRQGLPEAWSQQCGI